jgi:hypothetical protein
MKSTETSPSSHVLKKSQPEEFDLVILGGGTGSTIAPWTFAGEGKRVAVVDRNYIAALALILRAFRARTLSIARKLWTTFAEAKSSALLTMASRLRCRASETASARWLSA